MSGQNDQTYDEISCGAQGGPIRYCVNTEGTEHPWDRPSIIAEDIAKLGGWDPGQGVIEVRADNSERTLAPGEIVQLRPGRAFCRRVRWKRGLTRIDRIDAEIALLRRVYPDLEHKENWILLPNLELPEGWTPNPSSVALQISDSFPGAPPYGIYVPAGLRYDGVMPRNYTEPAGSQPPFGGEWGLLSWTIADGVDWRPGTSVERGVNLLSWVRGFSHRFLEGA